jgi:hypothetical protein
VITSAVHIDAGGNNVVRTERHPAAQNQTWYSDVDSYEERIGPVAATWQGNSDPVSLTVTMFEHDQGARTLTSRRSTRSSRRQLRC